MTMIPIVASVGCDDLSTYANETAPDEFLEVDNKLIEGKRPVVAVRAVGDSMTDADIHSGDYVLVQLTSEAVSGDQVVAVVGDTVTVKKLERRKDVTVLWPESQDPKYKPIILREDFKIAGKVICSIPSQSMDITRVVPEDNY
jgi:SOS-response transcriptional repressor LexA